MCSTSSVLRGGRRKAVAQVAEGRTYIAFTRPEEKALPLLIERRSASSLFFCYHIVLCCGLVPQIRRVACVYLLYALSSAVRCKWSCI